MTWIVIWSDKSKKQLQKLDKSIAKQIRDHVEDIKKDPRISAKRLVGSRFYRLRVGKYGVIFDLHKNKMIIFVIKLDNRKKVYKK